MSDAAPSGSKSESPKVAAGITGFITRVLEQLTISAWLPAAMLIGVGSVLIQLRHDNSIDILAAIHKLTNPESWFVVVALIFALVLATMVTQAFSFGAIRFLEGYWPSNRLTDLLVGWKVTRHVRRSNHILQRAAELELKLFNSARPRLKREEDPRHFDVWDDTINRVPKENRRQQDKVLISEAHAINWREKGNPAVAATYERARAKINDYPGLQTRILPTRLGNVLRAAEDRLNLEGDELERFVFNNYSRIPSRLMSQHDQFRDRLDMYSLLVLVFALQALASIPLLLQFGSDWFWVPPLVAFIVFGVFSALSYGASIASARGYGSTLLAMKRVADQALPLDLDPKD